MSFCLLRARFVFSFGSVFWLERFSIRRRAEALASADTRTLKRALYGETQTALETEQVGDLDDDGALEELAAHRVSPVVVDDIDVAERVVREVEAQVRADLVRVGVVLQERVEERPRTEAVEEARADEAGRELAVRQRDVVAAVAEIDVEVVVRRMSSLRRGRGVVAVPELAPARVARDADFAVRCRC